ncbi:MAG TPA: hypothetical protein VE783_09155 [Candidatus Limnocylindrales bacterium]|nr:hypothetical protein [Candidatus Limnocylindrales bacterium]
MKSRNLFGTLYRLLLGFLIAALCLPTLALEAQENLNSKASSAATASADPAPQADEDAAAASRLAKDAQNPVANLISVPLQNNNNFKIGPNGRAQDVLNIQPVIPLKLNDKWMLISRTIQPIVWQPFPLQTAGGQYGLGDMVETVFLSPAKPGRLIWGVGPALMIPTATSTMLGQGKLAPGPSVVVLTQPPGWTLGALINNVWSVSGSANRPAVNQMLMQCFVTRNLQKGWYLTTSPIITADWRASSGNIWTVPVGGGVGRITKMGFQPINASLQFYGNAAHPAGASSWSMRTQIALLFPQLTRAQTKMILKQKLNKMEEEDRQKQAAK